MLLLINTLYFVRSARSPSTLYIQPRLAPSYHTLLPFWVAGIKSQADRARDRKAAAGETCEEHKELPFSAVCLSRRRLSIHTQVSIARVGRGRDRKRDRDKGREGGEGDTGNASQALGEHMSKGVSEGLQWSSVNFDFPQAYYLTQMSSQHEGERREHNRETDREVEGERNSSLGSCIY